MRASETYAPPPPAGIGGSMRVVVPAWRSRRKNPVGYDTPPGVRLLLAEKNTTNRPSSLIEPRSLLELPAVPSVDCVTSVVSCVSRSRTYRSRQPMIDGESCPSSHLLLSCGTSDDVVRNSTKRPSGLIPPP